MKIKILFLIDNIAADDFEQGPARIINGLSRDRYEVYLACQQGNNFSKTIKDDVEYIPLDFSRKISPGLIFKLAGIIRRKRIGIIHAYGPRSDFHGRLARLISRNIRYVSTIALPEEGSEEERYRKRRPGLYTRFSNRLVGRFIAPSDLIRKEVSGPGGGINPDKIVRIYNGVDGDRFRHASEGRERVRAEFNIADDTVLIGAAGRLVWQKGFEFIIKSIPILIKSHPNIKILIAGDGPFKKHLIMHSRMIGIDSYIILAGFRNDIEDVLSAVDILVIPSLMDEFPMIALEGMAMAKPIVATRMEGITEQISDKENGLLVLSWDANALAKAINRLLIDRTFAEGLGKKAREKVERDFSTEKMIAETEKVYGSLCEGRG